MENENNKKLTSEEEKALFSNLEFKYSRSKEDVWNAIDRITSEDSMVEEERAVPQAKVVSINWRVWSLAASIVLILTIGLVARFYTTSIEVAPGEFTSHTLPDGSEVHLNAESSIAYQPYWWRVDRSVKMEGEAYFVVAKGKKFSVYSDLGTTQVLGTEFNVYARGDVFEVFCETGKVQVKSENGLSSVVLEPGQFAKKVDIDVVKQIQEVPEDEILSWRIGQFNYNNTPFSKVFDDIERHYGVTLKIEKKAINEELYTGIFKRDKSLEETLQTVGIPHDLVFEKSDDNTYLIKKK